MPARISLKETASAVVNARISCYNPRYCDFISDNATYFGGAMKLKLVFLFSLLILAAPPAFAGKPFPQLSVEYSADMEVSSNGKPQAAGKVFQSGKKQRMEMAGGASIMRLDKKVMWQLMPKEKGYMEMAIPEANVPPTEKNDAEMTEMGSETVNGVSATKYKVVSKEGGKKTEAFVWITKEGIMVKTEGKGDGGTVGSELKNLKIGKQDASLFEIPNGYKSMGNPMEMLAGARKQQREARSNDAKKSKKSDEEEKEDSSDGENAVKALKKLGGSLGF